MTPAPFTPLPYDLALSLLETAAEEEASDHSELLDAFRASEGRVETLSELQKATAFAFLADGAIRSSDPTIAGASAPSPSSISTSSWTPPPSLSQHGFARSSYIQHYSSEAWKTLDPIIASSPPPLEALELLCYLATRFSHPNGLEVKMDRIAKGIQETSDILDDEESPPEQSRAYMIGSSLVAIAGEESWTHNVLPNLPPYPLGQFVSTTELTPLPSPPLDLSALFLPASSLPTAFMTLFNSSVALLQSFSAEIERIHAKDIVTSSTPEAEELAVTGLWKELDKAFAYSGSIKDKLLSDDRLEKEANGDGGSFLSNPWTRAFLKNLLVQRVGFVGFEGVIWRNSTNVELKRRAEARVLERLRVLASDLGTAKSLTKTLDDIYPLITACFQTIHKFGPPSKFVASLSTLLPHERETIEGLLGFASYYDSRAGETLETLRKAVPSPAP